MTRLADAILNGQAMAYGRRTPMVDPKYGGQNGAAPNLAQWVSSSKYRPQQARVVLWEAPRGFASMPNGDYYINTLKAMFELHTRRWSGFSSTLEVSASEVAVGGANEMFQTPNKVTRNRTNITSEIDDLYGRPFQNFLEDWIFYLIGDPDTQTPMINTIADVKVPDMLADMYGCTILTYLPDPTNTKVDKAWLSTNVFPMSAGENNGERDLTSAREAEALSITWSGVTQTGRGVEMLAQAVMDSMSLTNANPMMRKAFADQIDPNVASVKQGSYATDLSNMVNSAVIAS